MIADNIKNSSRYFKCHKNIEKALQFINEHQDSSMLEDGKYEIVPDEVIVFVLTKDTQNRADVQMEIHKKFMDIHYMLDGSERCYFSDLKENIDYNSETDNGFYACKDTGSICIREGEFYAVWPMEPHCPLCNVSGQSAQVRKIICKVKVD